MPVLARGDVPQVAMDPGCYATDAFRPALPVSALEALHPRAPFICENYGLTSR